LHWVNQPAYKIQGGNRRCGSLFYLQVLFKKKGKILLRLRPVLQFNAFNVAEVPGIVGNKRQAVGYCRSANQEIKIVNRTTRFAKAGFLSCIQIK
jgi:hypothetical protein